MPFAIPRTLASLCVTLLVAACASQPPVSRPPEPGEMLSDPSTSPMIGEWRWVKKNTGCVEQRIFRADGTFTIMSAEEVVTGRYEVGGHTNSAGRIRLVTHEDSDNGKPDCGGRSTDSSGKSFTDWVKFSDDQNLHYMFAHETDSNRGYGPVLRIASVEPETAAQTLPPVPPSPQPPPEALTFAWPVPATALVTETVSTPNGAMQVRYRMHIDPAPQPGQLQISFDEYVLLPGIMPADVASLGAGVTLAPAFRVTNAGEFIELVDVEQWMDKSLATVLRGATPSAGSSAAITPLTSPETRRYLAGAIAAEMAHRWAAWVEHWVEMPPSLSEPFETKDMLEIEGKEVPRVVKVSSIARHSAPSGDVVYQLQTAIRGDSAALVSTNAVAMLAAVTGEFELSEQPKDISVTGNILTATNLQTMQPSVAVIETRVTIGPEQSPMTSYTKRQRYEFDWQH